MNANDITALDYLAAEEKARQNASDKPAFKGIVEEIRRSPEAQERLAVELLRVVRDELEKGNDPKLLMVSALRWSGVLRASKLQDYTKLLEEIILRSFRLMGTAGHVGLRFPPFYLPLNDGLQMLRKLDGTRFQAVIDTLRGELRHPEDPRSQLVSKFETI